MCVDPLLMLAHEGPLSIQHKGRIMTTRDEFLKRIMPLLFNASADQIRTLLEKRLDELNFIKFALAILRTPANTDANPEAERIFRACATILLQSAPNERTAAPQANARKEWDLPWVDNPLTALELPYRDFIGCVDNQYSTPFSKHKTTPFEEEFEHVPKRFALAVPLALAHYGPQASSLSDLKYEILKCLCTFGPKRMLITGSRPTTANSATSHGTIMPIWALVYESTSTEVESFGGFTRTGRTQCWCLKPYPPCTPPQDCGDLPSLETIRKEVAQYTEGATVYQSPTDPSVFYLTGPNLQAEGDLVSPVRHFPINQGTGQCDSDLLEGGYRIPGELSLLPYNAKHVSVTTMRTTPPDCDTPIKVEFAIINFKPGDERPNPAATEQLGCDVRGEVLVVPIAALPTEVRVHLGIQQEVRGASNTAKALDAMLQMTKPSDGGQAASTEMFWSYVQEGILSYVEAGSVDLVTEDDCKGLGLLPKLLFTLDLIGPTLGTLPQTAF